jgi:CubicO group peptidase (beta-lactamase class C family)
MVDWLADAARYAGLWLDHQLRATEHPGCALAIAHDGTLIAEQAYGMADLAAETPLTTRHRFRVASHSKTFTAAGIMALHEEGRLHLDDPVGRHVADLPADTGAVTLAQLMSHSAGVQRDGTDAGHWLDRRPFLDEASLRAALREPLTIAANTRFKYSNIGYGLLGLVIEAITGEPYGPWIARRLIAPSGLAATTPDMPQEAGVAMASGHGMRLPLGRRAVLPGHNPTHALGSATGFVSTAGDLARFFGSLDPAAAASALSVASRREMTRRHWRVPHGEPERHYGLGTIAGTTHGHDWFGHSGAFPGFISRTACVPAWGVTVAVVTNAIDGLANPWVDGILSILHTFGRHGPPEPSVAGWTGRWWSIWGPVDLVPMGGKVLVGVPGQLVPFADASEVEVTGPLEGRITLANGFGGHGEPVRRVLGPDGSAERLRLGGSDLVPEAALLAELAGRAGADTPRS